MPLSDHVYYVVVAFKMTEWVEQQLCIKFCIKLKHSSAETIQMIQKATATNIWWLAASSCVSTHSHITSPAEFFLENIKSPRWLSSPTTQIWHPVTSGFSQNQNHLWKGRDFRPWMRFRKMMGQLMEIGRTVWGPKVPTLRGTKVSLSYAQCFLYLVSSINVSIFHITWLDTLWTDLVSSSVVFNFVKSLFIFKVKIKNNYMGYTETK